jgi:hypothetical protein
MKIADLFAGLRLKPDAASFAEGDKLISGIKGGLAAIVAFSGFRWAQGMIQETVELGGAIADLSQKVGVPAETLQQLGYAAKLSGSSMEALGQNLGRLSKLAYDAGKGGKEAAQAFSKVGVKIKGADGALRPAEDLLADIADHIAGLPDGTEKTAKAMALFGRSGKDMIPLLNEGGAGIAKLRAEFVELGGQIDGEAVEALEAFGDEQDKVKVAIQGLKNQAVIAILPQLKSMVKTFLDWVKVNRVLLRQSLAKTFGAVVKVMRVLLKIATVLFKAIDLAFNFLNNYFDLIASNIDLVIRGLAAALGIMIAFKSAAIASAIATAAAWALPLAAIAAFLLLVEDAWVWTQGGKSALGTVHKALVDLFVKAIEFWVEVFDNFIDHMVEKLKSIPKAIRDGVYEFFTGESQNEQSMDTAIKLGLRNARQARDFAALSPEDREFMRDFEGSSPSGMFRHDPANIARYNNGGRPVVVNAPLTINVANGDPNAIMAAVTQRLEEVWRQTASTVAE